MKKIKILLPLASVVTIATTIVPSLTSCSGGVGTSDFNYLPTIAPHSVASYDETQATNEYFVKAMGNHDIIVQDYLYYYAQNAIMLKENYLAKDPNAIMTFSTNVSNVSIIKNNNEYLLSGTFTNSGKLIFIENNIKYCQDVGESYELKDVSVELVFASSTSTFTPWQISRIVNPEHKDWSARVIRNIVTEETVDGKTYRTEINSNNLYSGQSSASPSSDFGFNYQSYYFSVVTHQ